MNSNLLPNALPIALRAPRGATCALIAVCVLSSACATAINGTTQRVAVASDPPGAQVYVNDAPVGVTPAFVDVPRRDRDLELRLDKDGYEPARLALEREFSGWSWGNVLFAGVPINDYGVGQWDPIRSTLPARVTRAPGAGDPKPHNRLVPMQLTDRVHRLTGRWIGWDADPDRHPKPTRR